MERYYLDLLIDIADENDKSQTRDDLTIGAP
jgi:hypothetical protein